MREGQKDGDLREKNKERVEVAGVDCFAGDRTLGLEWRGPWGAGAGLGPPWDLRAEKRSVDVF